MDTPTQVFVVTSGEYSDYSIDSVWLTREEAESAAGEWAQVEVWPIGENERTLGTFSRSAQVDCVTGAVRDDGLHDAPAIASYTRAEVLSWPERPDSGQLGIRVHADTRERADKVFSETLARVLAEVSQGLPPELIADCEYHGEEIPRWIPTARVRGRFGEDS